MALSHTQVVLAIVLTATLCSLQDGATTVRSGLTGDFCLKSGKHFPCAGDRTCGSMKGGYYTPCGPTIEECYCIPLYAPRCKSSLQCPYGERCIYHMLAGGITMCTSCQSLSWFPFFKPTDDGVTCASTRMAAPVREPANGRVGFPSHFKMPSYGML